MTQIYPHEVQSNFSQLMNNETVNPLEYEGLTHVNVFTL